MEEYIDGHRVHPNRTMFIGTDLYYSQEFVDDRISELKEKDKEIERLNKEIGTLKQPQIFIDIQDMEERYGEELYKEYLEKENKRLNNIINELEKWLNEKICLNKNDKDYINGMTFVGVNLQMYRMFLDKLQGLKGSDKE